MLELGPQPTDTRDYPYIGDLPSGDAFTNVSHSSRSKSHSTINSDFIVGAISSDNGSNISHSSGSKSHSTIISDPMFNTTDDLGCSTNLKEKESALTDASVYKES